MHYIGKFTHPLSIDKFINFDDLKHRILHQPVYDSKQTPAPEPNYLIIWGSEEASPRVRQYEESGFKLKRISPADSESEQGFALYSLTLSSPL
jgi:hypothetical protein